jgi:type IV pilus assembly protein PilB
MITQPGDYFGEMSALLDQPRSATILSRGKSIVKIFPGDKLKESIENYNEIALKIINSIITRLQGADKRLSAMGQKVLQNDE